MKMRLFDLVGRLVRSGGTTNSAGPGGPVRPFVGYPMTPLASVYRDRVAISELRKQITQANRAIVKYKRKIRDQAELLAVPLPTSLGHAQAQQIESMAKSIRMRDLVIAEIKNNAAKLGVVIVAEVRDDAAAVSVTMAPED